MPETSQHSLSLRETCAHLKEDKRRVALLCARKFGYTPWMIWLDPSMLCVALYRIAHYSMRRGFGKMGHLLTQLNTILHGIDIHPASDIGAGLLIPHPHGVQFSANAGRNLTILPLAGVGSTFSAKDVGAGPGLSVLGDDICLLPLGGIIGPITVGDGLRIPPGLTLHLDAPAGARLEPPKDAPLSMSEETGHVTPCAPPPCRHRTWKSVWQGLNQDLDRYLEERFAGETVRAGRLQRLSAMATAQFLALTLYRVSHWLHSAGWKRTAALVCAANILLTKCTLTPSSCLGDRVFMPHPAAFVFHGQAGTRATFYGGSLCISQDDAFDAPLDAAPVLGDNVVVGAHGGVFGAVSVGSGSLITYGTPLSEHVGANMHVSSALRNPVVRKPNSGRGVL